MKKVFFLIVMLINSIFSSAYGTQLRCPKPGDDEENNKKIARKYFKIGLALKKDKDVSGSMQAFRCVLTFIPYSTSARFNYAQALDEAGQYSKAVKHYKIIVSMIKDTKYIAKIKKRISVIIKLKDKPIVVDPHDAEVKRTKQTKAETERLKKKYQKNIEELKSTIRINADYERRKKILIKKHEKIVKLKMDNYEKQIKHLNTMKNAAKKQEASIKHKDKPLTAKKTTKVKKIGPRHAIIDFNLGILRKSGKDFSTNDTAIGYSVGFSGLYFILPNRIAIGGQIKAQNYVENNDDNTRKYNTLTAGTEIRLYTVVASPTSSPIGQFFLLGFGYTFESTTIPNPENEEDEEVSEFNIYHNLNFGLGLDVNVTPNSSIGLISTIQINSWNSDYTMFKLLLAASFTYYF
jgi:tetratricopeptide (TPR) repeat protein